MPPRHVRSHCTGCDRLGNNPPLLRIAPPSAPDHAHDFRAALYDLRVVTDVDHNVHTICHLEKTHDRARPHFTQLCGVKAPVTTLPALVGLNQQAVRRLEVSLG
jgi:hypothetical protein